MSKIISLSKVFTKDYIKNLKVFKENEIGVNKKSILLWLVIIIMISLAFLSYKIIDFLIQARSTTNIFEFLYGNFSNIFIISSINDSN